MQKPELFIYFWIEIATIAKSSSKTGPWSYIYLKRCRRIKKVLRGTAFNIFVYTSLWRMAVGKLGQLEMNKFSVGGSVL